MEFRKGQLSFGFYAALIVFVAMLAYLTFRLFEVVPTSTNAIRVENAKIESYQLSELLINDAGNPLDWDTKQLSEIKRLGLSDSSKNKTNLVSNAKIARFKAICDNSYNDIKRLLDLEHETSITFKDVTSNSQWSCASGGRTQASFNVTRIIALNETAFGELVVEVWQR